MTSLIRDLCTEVNFFRRDLGIPELVLMDELNEAAQHHAESMKVRGNVSLSRDFNDKRVKDFVGRKPFICLEGALFFKSDRPNAIISQWLCRGTYRTHLMHPRIEHIGFGVSDYYWHFVAIKLRKNKEKERAEYYADYD